MPASKPRASDTSALLNRLLDALPLHAEEGGFREVLAESDLVARINSGDPHTARVTVSILGRLYGALGLLEERELSEGRWAFVSFPASLLARSILETLSADSQAFFEPGYWIQGPHRPTEVIEEQRALLRRLEMQRIHAHPTGDANAIRTVHVAWGIIRLGGRFLLRAREDTKRPEVKGHVFPGGRLDLTDLPAKHRTPASLRDLFLVDSNIAPGALRTTLARELREELDLLPNEYQPVHQRVLAPFKMLEGTRNNLAYTQYDVSLYTVTLTHAGELKVLDRVDSEPDLWVWFTAGELALGKRSDGKSAFIDALSTELGEGTERFLTDVPDSSTSPAAFLTETDSLELPQRAGEPPLRGITGRERPIPFTPTTEEWELLMVLGWHTRGLSILVKGESLRLLGAGWVRLVDKRLLETAQQLAGRLEEAGFPFLEVDGLGHCRISVDASQVFFPADHFRYSWDSEGTRKSILLTPQEIDLSMARLPRKTLRIRLAPNFTRNLSATEAGRETRGDFEREARDHFEPARAIGLRKFISSTKSGFDILVPPLDH